MEAAFLLGSPEAYIEALLGFNRLLAGTNLPAVPREVIRGIIERDTIMRCWDLAYANKE